MKIKPKRRKSKFNPYTIMNFPEQNDYAVKFKDINNKENIVRISKGLYNEFNKFELEDLSEMNEFDRHLEHSKLNEISLNKRIINKNKSLENSVIEKIENEELYNAILKLPMLQRNRIIMYYFEELSQKEIAIKEKCSIRAVQYSINIALKNLRKFIK